MALRALKGPFSSRYGVPILSRVDTSIFTQRYFTDCMVCGFCHDACCDHGVDVDLAHLEVIMRHAADLEDHVDLPGNRWFHPEIEEDGSMPGGGSVRSQVTDGRCVFRPPRGRGCMIHTFCVARGIDYHELKPMIDCLFPLSYYADVLSTSDEIDDGSLICMDTGPTLYRGVREELRYYFGDAFITALDVVEGDIMGKRQ